MTLVLSIIALCYMLLVVIYLGIRYCRAGRAQKYMQLKNFRKGTFGLIYLGAIPLYLAGNLYNGEIWFQAVFNAFSNALALMALSFKWSVVSPLAQVDVFYNIAVYLCFGAAFCNTVMFTFSLLARRCRNWLLLRRIAKGEKNLCVLVGDEAQMRTLISSVDREEYDLLLLSPLTAQVKELAFVYDFAVINFSFEGDIVSVLKKYACHTERRMVRVVVNTPTQEKNFLLAGAIGDFTTQLGWEHFSLDERAGFSAYVFGSEESESSYVRLSERTHGCVQCVDRYKLLAFDFAAKHPITECLHPDDIDLDTLTVSNDVSLNFVMIGFGRVSRQILRTHSVNSQLLCMKEGKPAPKPVNYRVYDVKETEKDKNLNHNLFRYANWYNEAPRGEEYPHPQEVFSVEYRHLDVADEAFYNALREDLTNVRDPLDKTCGQGKGLRNSIVISCGSDLVNVDFAEKLLVKVREWGLQDCTRIYVRVRDEKIRRRVISSIYAEHEVIAFGSELESCGSVSAIFAEGMEAMAKRQHLYYTRTDHADLDDQQVLKKAISDWYDRWTPVQRASNTYACLSARVKLNLLGLDLAPLKDPRPDASDIYKERYFQGADKEQEHMRVYTGEQLADYSVRRHMMTRLEHQRWNAYMISCGYVPAEPFEYLKESKQSLHRVRKHANIVRFEELIHQREALAAQRGCSCEECDVIKYDYRLADNLPELLAKGKQKIVECNSGKDEKQWT